MPQNYQQRKASWAKNPERHKTLMRQQSESRRRRKARQAAGTESPCRYPDGSACWRLDEHQHRKPSPGHRLAGT